MQCIIPLGGYATRLFPLTENFPKALLEVGNKPILDYVMQKVIELHITHIHLVSNHRYYDHFKKRLTQSGRMNQVTMTLHDDHTTSNEDRLGSLGDINFVLQQAHIEEDVLVVCGDNIFEFSLIQSYRLFERTDATVLIGHDVQSKKAATKYGIMEVNNDNELISFEEKPEHPKSTYASTGIYYYPQNIIKLLPLYLNEGQKVPDPIIRKKRPDASGNFPAWLLSTGYPVYAHNHTETRFDIGGFETLEEARKIFDKQQKVQ